MYENQFGFRQGKSTYVAITHLLSNLINNYNANKKIGMALLDLKKAFDFINHDLLLTKLKHYGLRGTPLRWIYSYLTNRAQRCKVNNDLSKTQPISAGVPQGSLLGSILFNIFINDVFHFNTTNIQIFLYADNTVILFKADNETDLQQIINDFFLKYTKWCILNCIVINPTKSNYLLFNCTNITMSINGHILDNPHVVKYLGVLIDDKLDWKHHVSYVSSLCSQRIGVFKKTILSYLPKDVILLYYNAFIRSCFSYCTVFWFNNNRSGKYKLTNKVDNIIHLLAKKFKQTVQEFVYDFQICDVYKVYKLQAMSLMYHMWYNRNNFVFLNLISNNSVHSHFTRINANIHVNPISAISSRNFIYHCILTWNDSPFDIRSLPKHACLSQYKKLFFSLV